MIVNLIVFLSILFALVFLVFWLFRPDLRAWIERPKYRFQANVRSYDQAQRALGQSGAKAKSGTRRSP
jgi:hypothetical protein